jgi:hypothetical protein
MRTLTTLRNQKKTKKGHTQRQRLLIYKTTLPLLLNSSCAFCSLLS